MADVIDLPVADIGLDPRPERQIRPLDLEHVRNLMETSDPEEWDAIEVRLWPESDPYPPGEEGRAYQVISGYHRTTAARNLRLPTIHATIITEPLDNLGFQLRAFHTNARHGKPMSSDEKQAVALRLRSLGMSENAIASEMGTPRGTVHNWLTGRDTNASRQKDVRTHKASGVSGEDANGLPDAWQVIPMALDDRRARAVSSTIADFLATTPTRLDPSEVVAWVNMQPPLMRRSLAADLEETTRWLGYLRTILTDMPSHETAPTAKGVA